MADDTYRSLLVRGLDDAQGSLDQWLLKLGAGALAIALGFVRTAAYPAAPWALCLSWVLLAASLTLVLFSFRSSRDSFRDALAQADDQMNAERPYRETPGGRNAKVTERLNNCAFSCFVAGIACLGYFMASNLGNLR